MTTPTIIETDLREVLAQINQKLDGINEIRVELAEIRGDIKALDERVSGLDKRLERVEGGQNKQIWALIGILFTAVVATAIRFVLVSLPNVQ
jgi:tetrahydromethanopterin S-methyltransferase subunit G